MASAAGALAVAGLLYLLLPRAETRLTGWEVATTAGRPAVVETASTPFPGAPVPAATGALPVPEPLAPAVAARPRTARPLPPSMVVTRDTPACEIHVVEKGESLWLISARRLGDPYRWPQLFGENRDRIVDPDVIEVADRIRIPGGCTSPGQAP